MSTHTTDSTPRDEQSGHELIRAADLPEGIRRYYPDDAMISPVYDGGCVVLQEVKV